MKIDCHIKDIKDICEICIKKLLSVGKQRERPQ